MGDQPNHVVLQEAGTQFHAELLVGALKNAGIDALAEAAPATDEFTMAQHMRGHGVRILVPADQLDAARAVVATIAEAAQDDAGEADGE